MYQKKRLLLVAMLALLLCLVCGSALASGSCKHSMTSTVVKEPTCTEKGRIELVCSSCGYESSASIPATGHEKNPTKVVGIRATCDKDGHYNLFCSKGRGFVATNVETTPAIVTYKCRLCDYSVEMRTEDYGSHLYSKVLVEGKQPTCTEDGVYPIYSCAHCDATYGGKVIPAYGHSLVIRLKKDADDPLRAPKEWYCVMCGYTDGVVELH